MSPAPGEQPMLKSASVRKAAQHRRTPKRGQNFRALALWSASMLRRFGFFETESISPVRETNAMRSRFARH
jgi:hypothetical protein